MQNHPFLKSTGRMLVTLGIITGTLLVQWLLLIFYNDAGWLPALADSLFSTGLLAVFCFFLWYIAGLTQTVQTDSVLTALVLVVWLAGCFAGQYISENLLGITHSSFSTTLPFRLLFGLLAWTLVLQWYRLQKLRNWKEERLATEQIEALPTEEVTDRIAVKDGASIHIIQVNDLIFVQACGDYVILVSTAGQYLKEQTMKHFETHLPASRFVRIHRSYLVNVEQIQRVELMGKDSYHVLLKDGTKLRASLSGYKLLKETLAL